MSWFENVRPTYTIGQHPVSFTTTIYTDSIHNPTKIELEPDDALMLRLERPDGTTFDLDAEPTRPLHLTRSEIKGVINKEDILNMSGVWTFRGVIKRSNALFFGRPDVFWVVPA